MKFGIFDIKDNCWIGTEDGPLSYDVELHAKAAATILNERRGTLALRARTLPEPPFLPKDTITPRLSAEEALRRLEQRIK
jgi:hypothetical protein